MKETNAFQVANWTAAETTDPDGLIVTITDSSGDVHRFWMTEQNWSELAAGVQTAFAMAKTRRNE